jgi:hypothetical protein
MRLLAGVIAAITVMLLAGWAEATNLTGVAGRPPAPHASLIERVRQTWWYLPVGTASGLRPGYCWCAPCDGLWRLWHSN